MAHEYKNHDMFLILNLVKIKNEFNTIRQRSEEKDSKIQQLEKECVQLKSNVREQRESLTFNFKCLSDLVESLQSEINNLKDRSSKTQIPVLGGERLKKDVDSLKTKVIDRQNKSFLFNKSVADMNLRILLVEELNGGLIWKIDKIDSRIAQVKLGKVTALHSAPYYTKQYEYKMLTTLYLDGNGIGRGTHISIFVNLMKSEFDELLQWPVKKRVAFELINLENQGNSVVKTFLTNPKSSSFHRPANSINVTTGFPKFITIEEFLNGGFIKDNSIFIRTTVEDV